MAGFEGVQPGRPKIIACLFQNMYWPIEGGYAKRLETQVPCKKLVCFSYEVRA